MANFSTIHNAKDYVNYVFNISTRGVMESTAEILGMSGTIQNVIGNLAFKTSEYLTNAETVSVGFGTAAVAAFSQATKQAIAFEQATASVEAISGKQLSGSDIGAKAMQMSSQFGMATSEMTEGLEALARAGITASDSITALLESGVQLSKFEGMNLEDSINSLISTVNLLNPELNVDSAEFGDAVKDLNQKIVSTSESSPINAENIMNSLQHVGGYASATGIDQDDLFAVIAQLGAKGTKGEITGTSLRAFVSAGQKDTAQRALDRIGLSVTDLWDESGDTMLSISEMKDVLDEALETRGYSQQEKLEFYSDFVGYKQANQIMKIDTSETAAYRDKIADSLSLTEKMNIILGTVQGNWNQIVNTATNFLTKIGKVMLPIVNAILIPIKMIVKFIDAIPFGEYIASFGIGLVAIQGISTAFNTLVPTIITFITKFIQFDKTSFSVKNMFEEIKQSLLDSKQIIQDIMDMNWDKINEITNSRESESTNKVLQERLSRESINEYFRQKYGVGDIYDGNGNIVGQYYKWDRMSRTEREYIMNKYRPEEAVIEAFTKHRTQAFDARYQGKTKSDQVPPSSHDFPGIDDVEEELRRRQTQSQENTEQYTSGIYNQLQNLSNHTFKVEVVNKDFKSHVVDTEINERKYNFNDNNANSNTTHIIFNPITGAAAQVDTQHIDRNYVPKAATNTISRYADTIKREFTHNAPITQADTKKAIQMYFDDGEVKIYSPSEQESKTHFGASRIADKRIRINPYAIVGSKTFGRPLALKTSQDMKEELGDAAILGTFVHELAHSVLSTGGRESESISGTYRPGSPVKLLDSGDSRRSYDGYGHGFGTETEANYAEQIVLQQLGLDPGSMAQDRVIGFTGVLKPHEDINLDLVYAYVDEWLKNPFEFLNMLDKQIQDLDMSDMRLATKIPYVTTLDDAKRQEVLDNIKKEWEFTKKHITDQYDMLEALQNSDAPINDILTLQDSNLATHRSLISKAHLSFNLAQNAPAVFEIGQAEAAKRYMEERDRLQRKIDEFRNNPDVQLKAYRKNFDTSVMTDEGFDFAIMKNQRSLNDFLINGNTQGLKTQFRKMMGEWQNANILNSDGSVWGADNLLRDFAQVSDMQEFLDKYNALTRDADKIHVREAFLKTGQKIMEQRLNSKDASDVNYKRRSLITTDDYTNMQRILGIDFSGAQTNKERYNILQDWLKNQGKGRQDDVARVLQIHDDKLARTMESASVADNVQFLEYLRTTGVINNELLQQLTKQTENGTILQGSKFHAFNVLNELSPGEKDRVYQEAERFFGGFAEFGQAAMYEIGLHFEEMKLLADRAGIAIEDIMDMPDLPEIMGFPGDVPVPIPVKVINMPDFPGVPAGVSVIPTDDDGNPIPPKPPIPMDPEDYGPQQEPIIGPNGTEATRGQEEVIEQIEEVFDPDKFARAQKWAKKFNEIIDNVLKTLGGEIDEEGNHKAGNRFSQRLDDFFGQEKFKDKFGNFVDSFQSKADTWIHSLRQWEFAFEGASHIFPPFIAVAQALTGTITFLTMVTEGLTMVESALADMRAMEGMFSIFKGTKAEPFIKQIEKRITGVLNAATVGIQGMIDGLIGLAPILGPILIAIVAIVGALKWSQSAHDEYLKKLKEEGETLKKEDQAAQISYENALNQYKSTRGARANNAQRVLAEEHLALAETKLNATNQKRRANLMKQVEQENDGLWGNYGMRASVQKTGWFESIFSMGVPFVGTIAKALAGEFESEVDKYAGTTGQIREITEQTIGTPNIFGPQPTQAQYQVAAYYKAHQAAFATIDNYKQELGELYDFETKLIKGMGSKERARASKAWNRQLNRVVKATGLTADQIEEYLDYMQIEHTTETAKNAMQAHADQIVSDTELQVMAIASGASVEDAMGLNGLEQQQKVMIQAQADMVRQQAADTLWWKGFWSSLAAVFWQIASPITFIVNLLEYIWGVVSNLGLIIYHAVFPNGPLSSEDQMTLDAIDRKGQDVQSSMGDFFGYGREGQKANAYWDAYNKIQNEDFYGIGERSVSDMDRADYGGGEDTHTYMSTTTATPLANGGFNEGLVSEHDSTTRGDVENATEETTWLDSIRESILGPKTAEEKKAEADKKLADEKQRRLDEFKVRGNEVEGIWKAVSILESIDSKIAIFGTLGLGMGGFGLLGGHGGLGGTHGIGSIKSIFQSLMNSKAAQWIKNSEIGEKAANIKDKLKGFADEHGLDEKVKEKAIDRIKNLDMGKVKEKLSNINLGGIKDRLSNVNLGGIKDRLSNVNLGGVKDRIANSKLLGQVKDRLSNVDLSDIKDKITNSETFDKVKHQLGTVYENMGQDGSTFADDARDFVNDHITDKLQDRFDNPEKLKKDYKRIKNSKIGKKLGNSRVGKAASKGVGRVGQVASKGLGRVGKSGVGKLAKVGGKGIAKAGGKLLGKVAGKVGGRLIGMEIGAALGSVVPGLGTVIGAGIGWLAGELIGGGIEWLMNGGADAKDANGHKQSATRGNKKGINGALSGLGKWVGGGVKKTAQGIGGAAKSIGDVLFAPINMIGSAISGGIGLAGKGAEALVSNHPVVKGIQALHSLTEANETKRAKDYAEGKSLSAKIKDHTGEANFNVERIIEHLDGISSSGGSVVIKNININTADDPEAIKTALMNMIIELKDQVAPRTVGRTIGEPPSSTTTDTDTSTDPNAQDGTNSNGNTNGTGSNTGGNSPNYY